MASAVSPASLAEDSSMMSAISSSPVKKSWLEIRMVMYNLRFDLHIQLLCLGIAVVDLYSCWL